ncbi:hypothetical protein DMC30DRAFT_177372 [Rhodotorula diobovata]|uniref:Uncharacterized protein n=1 Tax=Rhodotorula diobovata TaxID=5288 RepID=A0A5C5G055_9BASI|nr:hypothetical protein DMC30DRAFT_177372 [Rhodotorula diobovata]
MRSDVSEKRGAARCCWTTARSTRPATACTSGEACKIAPGWIPRAPPPRSPSSSSSSLLTPSAEAFLPTPPQCRPCSTLPSQHPPSPTERLFRPFPSSAAFLAPSTRRRPFTPARGAREGRACPLEQALIGLTCFRPPVSLFAAPESQSLVSRTGRS